MALKAVQMQAAAGIAARYENVVYDRFFYAEHDVIYWPLPHIKDVRTDDIHALSDLGVHWDEAEEHWYSFV